MQQAAVGLGMDENELLAAIFQNDPHRSAASVSEALDTLEALIAAELPLHEVLAAMGWIAHDEPSSSVHDQQASGPSTSLTEAERRRELLAAAAERRIQQSLEPC